MLQAKNEDIKRLECVVAYHDEKIEKLRGCVLQLLEKLGDARKQNSCVAGLSEQLTSEKVLTEHLKTQLEEKTKEIERLQSDWVEYHLPAEHNEALVEFLHGELSARFRAVNSEDV
jgi:uncharacterized coiled-coil protein SlyX